VLYLAARLPRPGLHNIAKVFYFADKRHLREYGRLICGDSYVAMKYGPAPSAIYGMLKAVRGDARDQWTPRREVVSRAKGAFSATIRISSATACLRLRRKNWSASGAGCPAPRKNARCWRRSKKFSSTKRTPRIPATDRMRPPPSFTAHADEARHRRLKPWPKSTTWRARLVADGDDDANAEGVAATVAVTVMPVTVTTATTNAARG